MRVKKLISFYENQHYFTILFIHNFLSRWLNESFRFFCISYVEIQKNRFILVHFTKSLFLFFFAAYRTASILALASSTSELLIVVYALPWSHAGSWLPSARWWGRKGVVPSPSFVWLQPLWWWQIHLIQLLLNEQRGTTSLWSFPFVRCIHSDYITWLSKWLCMQIIPSFLADKASCTRHFWKRAFTALTGIAFSH